MKRHLETDVPAMLNLLTAADLRILIAHAAGILAARSGCYEAATVLRRIADALLTPRKTA